jgi:signal transduction histidine kinase
VRGSPTAEGTASEVLGHLVLTVPDPSDLLVTGLSSGPGALLDDGGLLAGRRPLEMAMIRRGLVVAGSEPDVSREPGGFGPVGLGTLSPKNPSLAWDDGTSEGVAAWSEERGTVLALRRRAADLGDLVLALARLVVVSVGLAGAAALVVLLLGLKGFRTRLHHRILVSYFVISVIPLVLLAWASAGEARTRHDARFTERLQADIGRARGEFEAQGPQVFDINTDEVLRRSAWERRHDLVLYRADGEVSASSRAGLVEAELEPARLPAEAYRATVLERRQTIRREKRLDGRSLWIGYAPVLGPDGGALATVAVPLLYDKDRINEELTLTGSVLLAAYLLTLVLVLAIGIWSARLLARPLDLLARGTKDVARGDLTVVLPGEGQDELGQLVAAFNAMTRALQEATEKAAQAEREAAWRRMARQVAHEIKNPLSPMKLMLQQMEVDIRAEPAKTSESIHRTATVLLKQIDALARIAGDFANFARLPAGEKKPVDVAALVRHVTDLHGGARALGVDVAADLPTDLPTVVGDEEELRRVLVNLVNNALEAVRGPGRVTVRARSVSHGGHMGVAVEVEDTGIGIEPVHLARLFEPDFSTKTRGTGLGLAIVKRILDDLGGTIKVKSAVGRGSAFRMWWPCVPAGPAHPRGGGSAHAP